MKSNDNGLVAQRRVQPMDLASRTFYIKHIQRIAFDVPVFCEPTLIRLHPRTDAGGVVRSSRLDVTPRPAGMRRAMDADGNIVWQVWFGELTVSLSISVTSCVERATSTAHKYQSVLGHFDDFSGDETARSSCLLRSRSLTMDTSATVQRALHVCDGSEYDLLRHLTSTVAEKFATEAAGAPASNDGRRPDAPNRAAVWAAAEHLATAARSLDIPTRLVRGYCAAAADEIESDMHVWCEFYLSGFGWCGFDPINGQPIDATYIPVAAGRTRNSTCAVSGEYRGTSRRPETSTQIILREAARPPVGDQAPDVVSTAQLAH